MESENNFTFALTESEMYVTLRACRTQGAFPMRSFVLALGLSLVACSAAPTDEAGSTDQTSDELVTCAWLNGGGCSGLPSGNWRSAEFWGELYLLKYSSQLEYAMTHVEQGPGKIQSPRAVLLITGVTIKKEWLDPIKVRL